MCFVEILHVSRIGRLLSTCSLISFLCCCVFNPGWRESIRWGDDDLWTLLGLSCGDNLFTARPLWSRHCGYCERLMMCGVILGRWQSWWWSGGGRGWRIGALINIEAGTRCISSSFDLCGLPFVTELSHWRRGGCVQVLPSLPVWLTGPLCTGGVGWSGRIEACNGMWFGFLQKWSPIVLFILISYER